MPQQTDPATGNFIGQGEIRADPLAPVTHRAGITTADGTTRPAANSGLWASNPGNRAKCRVFVDSTGSPATLTLRPYVRSGGTTGKAGTMALQAFNGSPNFDCLFDVQCDGDDLLVLVETLAGGSSPSVTVALSWR